ncbi:MAG: HD domain-containing protein [Candidatus Jettenia sp.]|nr:MAG: HD domain-containing protein [Candidatus Jettenia sp.]
MEISKLIDNLMDHELIGLLLSNVTDLTYIYDTEGNVLFVNKIFEKFIGHRPEEFYGKPFASLYDESNLKEALNMYARTLKGECPQYELYFKNTKVLCEYKNFPLKGEKGNIIGVIGIARDITHRKQGEEVKALNESLEKRIAENSMKLVKINEELTEEIYNRKRLESESKQNSKRLQKSLRCIIQTMASVVELRDSYAVGHQKRVAQLACCIAEEMGLSQERIDGICFAANLHDIGKVSVPAEILGKVEQLTEGELNMLKNHSRVGYDIVKEIESPYPVAQIVLQHHERINRSGYPMSLSDKDILLEAKILAVADVVEAISFPRPYRSTFGLDKALDEISQNRGILYDLNVVHACLVLFHEKGFKFEQKSYANLRLFEDVLLKI